MYFGPKYDLLRRDVRFVLYLDLVDSVDFRCTLGVDMGPPVVNSTA